ncbi:MAG: hypothetical protein NT031_06345 [Planctomycetota bacterium]|nr:hypothetical protein [Planctomycetota bacterium]
MLLALSSVSAAHSAATAEGGAAVHNAAYPVAGGMVGAGLMGALFVAIGGLVLVGLGQVFLCLRDSARNSFYLQRLAYM